MKKFYIVLVGLLIGLGVGSDLFGQQIYPGDNEGVWSNDDFGTAFKTSWVISGNNLSIGTHSGKGSGSRNSENWAFSPAIQLKDVSNFLQFSEARDGSGSSFSVMIAQDNNGSIPDRSSFVTVNNKWPSGGSSYQNIDLSPWSGLTVRLAFLRINELGAGWEVNNIEVIGSNLPEVENFKVSNITEGTISLSWDASQDGVEYLLVGSGSEIDFTPHEASTEQILMQGTSTSYTESGLEQFQSRYYKIWTYDPIEDEYSMAGQVANGTTIGEATLFYEDFEGDEIRGTNTFWESGKGYIWTIESHNFSWSDNWFMNGTATSYRGSKSAFIVQQYQDQPTYNGGQHNYLITTSFQTDIDLPASPYKSMELSFFWKLGGKAGYDYGKLQIIKQNGDIANEVILSESTKWVEQTIDITDFIDESITIKFEWENSPDYTAVHEPSFAVDEVMVTGKLVERPASFSATVVSSDKIDLAWQKNSSGNDVIVAYSSSGAMGAPDESTPYVVGDILPGGGEIVYKGAATGFSHLIEDENKANYKIWSVGEGDIYSTALSASTVMPASLPFFDGFEEEFRWNTVPYKDNDWYRGQAIETEGNYSAYVSNKWGFTTSISNYWDEDATILELPVNLAGYEDITLDFDYKLGESNSGAIDEAYVEFSDGTSGSYEFTPTEGLPHSNSWSSRSFTVSAQDANSFGGSSVFRFYFYGNTNNTDLGLAIDNVSITGTLKPVSGVSALNNGGFENEISWTNAADNLEVVIVSGINSGADGINDVLTTGEKYYEGDILPSGGKIIYIGTGESYKDVPVMPGQSYKYKIFQKNGLTYSIGVETDEVNVPNKIEIVEDFEDEPHGWNTGSGAGNSWFVGKPSNNKGNETNFAYVSYDNDGASAGYIRTDKHTGDTQVILRKEIEIPAFSSITSFQFDYFLHFLNAEDFEVKVLDRNDNAAVLHSNTWNLATQEEWTSMPVVEFEPSAVDNRFNLTLEYSATIDGSANNSNNLTTHAPGFLIDNISFSGTYDATSTVASVSSSDQDISSLSDINSAGEKVFTFEIQDAPEDDGDGRPTIIHQMTIRANNSSLNDPTFVENWQDVIGDAAIFNSNDEVVAYGTVQTQGILFDQENVINVPDNTSAQFYLKIWLKESLDSSVDNKKLDFVLSNNDVVAYDGSTFDQTNPASSVSNVSTIRIVATELRWSQHPSVNAVAGTILTTQPIIIAADANGNVDGDYVADLSLDSSPVGVGGSLLVSPTAGVFTFSNVVFGTAGTYVLEAASGALVSITSQSIEVVADNSEILGDGPYIGAVQLESIENYTFGRSENNYGLFIDQVALLTKGVQYEMTILLSEKGHNLDVFVDYDGNNIIDEDNELLFSKEWRWDDTEVIRENISINDKENGSFRLRVKYTDGNGNGEIEDYTVVINDNQWTGYTPEWDVTANWSSGQVPTDKVYIPGNPVDGNFFPVIKEDKTINELILESGANITVKPGVAFTIANDVTNNGQFVLESTADNLSSLMLPSNATKVGDANVKLEVDAGKYWYLSHPIKGATTSIYSDFTDMENERLWVYRHISGYTPGWFRVNRPVNFLNMEGAHMINDIQDIKLDYTGTLNAGLQERTFNGAGWHLFGNPYPVAIDWKKADGSGMSRTGISGTIYNRIDMGYDIDLIYSYNIDAGLDPVSQFDPEDLGYTDENISYIAPYQAVWIRTTQSTATLHVNDLARVSDNSMPLKSGSSSNSSSNLIRIKISNQYIFDAAVLYFNDDFSAGKGAEDVNKYFNADERVPEVYTRIDQTAMAINGLPSLSGSTYSIPLSVRNRVEGEVKLSADLDEFKENYDVVLEDKATGSWTNMRDVQEYVYVPSQMGDDHDRFVLHLSRAQQVPTDIGETDENASNIQILGKKDYALVRISPELVHSSEAVIRVLDVNGRLMTNLNTRDTETEIALPSENGVYVVRVNAGGTVKTKKVVR